MKNELINLMFECEDQLMLRFIDLMGDNKIDEKIAVLKQLAAGVAPIDIVDYYDVMDTYPANGEKWD